MLQSIRSITGHFSTLVETLSGGVSHLILITVDDLGTAYGSFCIFSRS